MPPRTLGELEFLVLLSVGQLGDDAYGAEVRRHVSKRAGRDYSVGAIYASLERLEQKSMLRSIATAPLPVRGGRSRRLFKVTAAGTAALKRGLAAREKFWRSFDPDWTSA